MLLHYMENTVVKSRSWNTKAFSGCYDLHKVYSWELCENLCDIYLDALHPRLEFFTTFSDKNYYTLTLRYITSLCTSWRNCIPFYALQFQLIISYSPAWIVNKMSLYRIRLRLFRSSFPFEINIYVLFVSLRVINTCKFEIKTNWNLNFLTF